MKEKIHLEPPVIASIVSFLMGGYNRPEIPELFSMISKINKIELEKVKLFFNILIIFSSNKES